MAVVETAKSDLLKKELALKKKGHRQNKKTPSHDAGLGADPLVTLHKLN